MLSVGITGRPGVSNVECGATGRPGVSNTCEFYLVPPSPFVPNLE